MDFVMNLTRIPQAGETSIEEHTNYIPGGKGSNPPSLFAAGRGQRILLPARATISTARS